RRVDPARELLQLGDRVGESGRDRRQLESKVAAVGPDLGLRLADGQSERDKSLLDAIVEVSLDPTPSLVRRADDSPARGGELGLALCIRDRGRDKLRELLQPFLGVER